jgi:hypothetical protein
VWQSLRGSHYSFLRRPRANPFGSGGEVTYTGVGETAYTGKEDIPEFPYNPEGSLLEKDPEELKIETQLCT